MRVADIQRFCMHDGPGIRTTIFLKGCPLSCVWCHNPETQSNKRELLYYETKCIGCGACAVCNQNAHKFSDYHTIQRDLCIDCGECATECPAGALEIVGKEYTIQELLKIIGKDRAFYDENGGVTLSGGEPFMQPQESLSLLAQCKEIGIHTAVETCGYFSPDILDLAVPLTDLLLWDIKDTDPKRHKEYTGVSNEMIINNLKLADSMGAKTRIRCILVSNINTTIEHYNGIVDIYNQLNNCEGVEFVPYHSFGGAKAVALGRFNSGNDSWIPSKERVSDAKEYLRKRGISVF